MKVHVFWKKIGKKSIHLKLLWLRYFKFLLRIKKEKTWCIKQPLLATCPATNRQNCPYPYPFHREIESGPPPLPFSRRRHPALRARPPLPRRPRCCKDRWTKRGGELSFFQIFKTIKTTLTYAMLVRLNSPTG